MTEKFIRPNRRWRWTLLVAPLVLVAVILVTAIAGPPNKASAHGATTDPASRTYACYLEGPENPTTPACQAAVAAGGTQPLYDWFAVRDANAAGRTAGYIPDGHLCSANNPEFLAYDAPRADWPATTLQAGATYNFVYGAWVPHPGWFRFYLTNSTYDPTKPLTWSEMNTTPFLTVNPEPSVVDGAYHMTGTLPSGVTGRQILYVVWTRTDSNETFYSCSDVVFGQDGTYPTPTPVPVTCTAAVTVTNSWSGGYQANVAVTNTSGVGLIPWLVSWTVPSGVTLVSGWNADVSQDGTKILANAPSWQRTLGSGVTATIGYVANGSSSPPPSNVTLNGTACTSS